jgi:hypothetical protein
MDGIMRYLTMGRAGVIVLILAVGAFGDTVELPLTGSAGFYDVNTPAWTMDFDLGVTFSEISHVYIDWSGEINASLTQDIGDPEPIPGYGRLWSYIDAYPPTRSRFTMVAGGISTYPDPETFNMQSEFLLDPGATWNSLLDGKEAITIEYPEFISTAQIIDYGSATLNEATLVVEGTIIPEPSTLVLLGLGFTQVLHQKKR